MDDQEKQENYTLAQQDVYTIRELFDFLPVTIRDLGKLCDTNEVTLARIRDGASARRSTVNKLMIALSNIYKRPLSVKNVTGINSMVNKRLEKKERKAEGVA